MSIRALLITITAGVAIIIAAPAASAFAATINVNGTTGADTAGCGAAASPCKTIGAALNPSDGNAVDSDTVLVAAGTYVEQVSITKGITLDGAGVGQTIIQSPAHSGLSTCYQHSGSDTEAMICIVAADAPATVENLTVNADSGINGDSEEHGCASDIAGIAVQDSSATIDNAEVDHARLIPRSATGGCQGGIGIEVRNPSGNARSITIENSTINDYQKGGITIHGTGLAYTVTGNTLVESPAGDIAPNGIEIGESGSGTVSNNDVTGDECNDTAGGCGVANPITGVQSAGILLYDDGTVTVSGNTVSDSDIGIFAGDCSSAQGCTYSGTPTTSDITGNTLTNNRYEGLFAGAGNVNATGNTISGSDIGVENASFNNPGGPDPGDANLTLTNNSLSNNGTGIEEDEDQSGSNNPHTTAHMNVISGGNSGITNNTSQDVDANDNLITCSAGSGPQCVQGSGVTTSSLILKVSAASSSIGLNGQTDQITAELVDSAGDVASAPAVPNGSTISFSTSLGSLPASGTTTDGVATVNLSSGATAGAAAVSALFDGQIANISVTFAAPAPALTLRISAGRRSVGLGGTDTITATVLDSAGHTATTSEVPDGTKIGFATSLGSIPATATTTNGVATVQLSSGTNAGTAVVAAGFDGQAVTTDVAIGPVNKPPTTTVVGAVVVSGGTLRESKGVVLFSVENPQSKSATATLTLSAKIGGRTVTIARRTVTIGAHKTVPVGLTLSAAARRSLAKANGHLRVTLTALVAGVHARANFTLTR